MTGRYILHRNDLPAGAAFDGPLAIDGEFMGLNPWRDRLCLLQVYDGRKDAPVHIVQFERGAYDAPNLRKLLSDPAREKIMFFARADMRWTGRWLGVVPENVYCLKIASRIARTYTQAHGLENVVKQILDVRLPKEQACTDWGAAELSPAQLEYACNDVLYLHALRAKLEGMLERQGRAAIVRDLCACLPAVVRADLAGWNGEDHFSHDVKKPD